MEVPKIKPWLIHRCSMKEHSLSFKPSMKVSDYIDLDYMGSAEFEFGAFPKMMRNIHKDIDRMEIFEVEKLRLGIECWAMCRKEHVDEVKGAIVALSEDMVRLKEPTYFPENYRNLAVEDPILGYQENIRLWICIDRDREFMFCFSKKILENMITAVKNSIKFMDEKAKEANRT